MLPLDEILDAVAVLHSGDRDTARARLEDLWTRVPEDAAFDRAIVGHYLADAQDCVEEELAWDLRALAAATSTASTAERVIGGVRLTLASFLPSLHLNVASAYERLGDLARARDHARHATAHLAHLDDSPLATLTRDAIARLTARIG